MNVRSQSVAVCVLLLITMLGACATPSTSESPSRFASASTLGTEFGGCDGATDGVDAIEFLAGDVAEWVEVVDVESRDITESERIEVSTGDGQKRSLTLFPSMVPGIEWGLQNGAEVWLAVANPEVWQEDLVATVMVVTAAGSVFFAGDCGDTNLRKPLTSLLGERTDDVLAGLPDVAPGAVKAYLGVDESSHSGEEEAVILNPDSADASLLATLTLGSVIVTPTAVPGDGQFVVATRIAAGWNEGAVLDEASIKGTQINAYTDEGRELEFWLLDYYGNVNEPLGFLGSITVEGSATSVVIDASGIADDGTIVRSDLVKLATE